MRIKKKMLKNIFAKNHRKNLHKHPGPPFQIRPGQGYFSRAEIFDFYVDTECQFQRLFSCRFQKHFVKSQVNQQKLYAYEVDYEVVEKVNYTSKIFRIAMQSLLGS